MDIKVLHLLYKVDIGGTERAVLNYISENNDKSIINHALALHNGSLSSRYTEYSRTFSAIDSSNIVVVFYKLKAFLKKNKFDIIYTYGFRANLLLRFMPKEYKLIYGVRGQEKNIKGYISILNKLTIKRNDLIVTNSYSASKRILDMYNIDKNNVKIIYNGTYLPKKSNRKLLTKNDVINIIIVANLNPVKGFKYLLPPIKRLINEGENIQLTILGEGPLRSFIESFIEENNLETRVKLKGQVKDVYYYLKKSDILISSSLSEGLSNSIIEGMACSLPIIATNVGGSSELVVNEETGILIESKSEEAIYQAIKKLINSPKKMLSYGEKSRKRVEENFTFNQLVNENNTLFRSMRGSLNE